MGAYEALWTKAGATFKTIADRFRAKPSAVPSDSLQSAVAYKFAEEVVNPASRQRNEAPLVLGVAFGCGGAHLGQTLGHVVLE
jgi:hypothetical protein